MWGVIMERLFGNYVKILSVLLSFMLFMGLFAGCSDQDSNDQNTNPSDIMSDEIDNGASVDSAAIDDADLGDISSSASDIVVFETTLGNFEVKLYPDKAPISVANFLRYVNDGFYDELIFHRIIDGFMVQGGGFDKDMNQKETKNPIKNEADNGLKNEKYTIAMARTMVIDSATAQFYVNVVDNEFLDHKDKTAQGYGYAVFGRVISGTETIDKIKAVETATKGMFQNVPVEAVTINKAYVKE